MCKWYKYTYSSSIQKIFVYYIDFLLIETSKTVNADRYIKSWIMNFPYIILIYLFNFTSKLWYQRLSRCGSYHSSPCLSFSLRAMMIMSFLCNDYANIREYLHTESHDMFIQNCGRLAFEPSENQESWGGIFMIFFWFGS